MNPAKYFGDLLLHSCQQMTSSSCLQNFLDFSKVVLQVIILIHLHWFFRLISWPLMLCWYHAYSLSPWFCCHFAWMLETWFLHTPCLLFTTGGRHVPQQSTTNDLMSNWNPRQPTIVGPLLFLSTSLFSKKSSELCHLLFYRCFHKTASLLLISIHCTLSHTPNYLTGAAMHEGELSAGLVRSRQLLSSLFKKRDRERIALVTLYKKATVSKSLMLLFINEGPWGIRSGCSWQKRDGSDVSFHEQMSDLLEKPMSEFPTLRKGGQQFL